MCLLDGNGSFLGTGDMSHDMLSCIGRIMCDYTHRCEEKVHVDSIVTLLACKEACSWKCNSLVRVSMQPVSICCHILAYWKFPACGWHTLADRSLKVGFKSKRKILRGRVVGVRKYTKNRYVGIRKCSKQRIRNMIEHFFAKSEFTKHPCTGMKHPCRGMKRPCAGMRVKMFRFGHLFREIVFRILVGMWPVISVIPSGPYVGNTNIAKPVVGCNFAVGCESDGYRCWSCSDCGDWGLTTWWPLRTCKALWGGIIT